MLFGAGLAAAVAVALVCFAAAPTRASPLVCPPAAVAAAQPQDLRSPDAVDAAARPRPASSAGSTGSALLTPVAAPAVAGEGRAVDWSSAGVGAGALLVAGLVVALLVAVGPRGRRAGT